jgi:thiol-disulfide isomerase/thioredoxin
MTGIRAKHAACLLLLCVGVAAAEEAKLAELAVGAGMEAYPVPLKAPAFRLPDLKGEMRGNADYRGRVVLLNFWGSWCPPCRDEFPSLVRLQRALPAEHFTVLAVAVADTEEGIVRFLGGENPPFDILLDPEREMATAFRAPGVPVTYVLDRDGRLLAGRVRAQHWDSPAMQRLIRNVAGSGSSPSAAPGTGVSRK